MFSAGFFSFFDVIDIEFANDTFHLVLLQIRLIEFKMHKFSFLHFTMPDQIPDEYSSLLLAFYDSILFQRIDLLYSILVPAERL